MTKYQIFGLFLILYLFSCVSRHDKIRIVDTSSQKTSSIDKEDLTESKVEKGKFSQIVSYEKLIQLGEKYTDLKVKFWRSVQLINFAAKKKR